MQLQSVLVLLAAAGAAMAQGFSINTPTNAVIECVPLRLTWTGGQGPFDLTVHTYSGSPGPVIDHVGNLQGTSYTYKPSGHVGSQLEFQLTDSTGAVAQSGATPAVASNPDANCGGGSGSGSSSAAPSGSSSAAPSGSSSSGSPSSSDSGSKSASASSGSKSSAPSAGSASSGGGSGSTSSSASSGASAPLRVSAGLAGFAGLAAAALL